MNTSPAHASSGRLPLGLQVGLLMGPLLSMLDESVINVALPDIAQSFHSSLSTVQWVMSAYLLALSAFLATSSYLAKRFGTLQAYTACLLGFTVGSALCALSNSIALLIAARILQGALGAPLLPLSMTLIQRSTGRSGSGISPMMGIMLFLGPALGPTVSGVLVHWFGWPSIFLVNVPIGLVGFLVTLRVPRGVGDVSDPSVQFDPAGQTTLALGLGLAAYAASMGPVHGWLSTSCLPYLLIGALVLSFYGWWSFRHVSPALDLKLLRNRQNAICIVLCSVTTVVSFSTIVLAPVVLQEIQGASAFTTGLVLFPQALATLFGFSVGNKLIARYGVRGCALTGTAVLLSGTVLLQCEQVQTPPWIIALLLIPRSAGTGLVTQPALQVILQGLSEKASADANTIFNVAQRLSAGIGIALLTTYFQIRENANLDRVLNALHIGHVRLDAAAPSTTSLPASVKGQLATAGLQGFHDTIWMIAAVAMIGLLMTLPLEKSVSSRSSALTESAGLDGERLL
jgi:EmrB/QacA subfamily drug resistance transporter